MFAFLISLYHTQCILFSTHPIIFFYISLYQMVMSLTGKITRIHTHTMKIRKAYIYIYIHRYILIYYKNYQNKIFLYIESSLFIEVCYKIFQVFI